MNEQAPTPPTVTTPTPRRFRLRRQPIAVRPHPSGGWTICIGKYVDKRTKSKLRPKDHYFPGMTENAANARAGVIAKRWENIVRIWTGAYQPALTALGKPFADTPHWDAEIERHEPTAAEIEQFRNRPPTSDEIAEAHGPITVNNELVSSGITLTGVYSLFTMKMEVDAVKDGGNRTTAWTEKKNLRCGMRFFDGTMPMGAFTADTLRDARNRTNRIMRRTAENYLAAIKKMLVWFYESPYGKLYERPSSTDLDKAISVKTSKASITTYDFAELKALLNAAVTGRAKTGHLWALQNRPVLWGLVYLIRV